MWIYYSHGHLPVMIFKSSYTKKLKSNWVDYLENNKEI